MPIPQRDPLPDRLDAIEECPGEGLVHDGDRIRPFTITGVERSSLHDRDPHGAEVVAIHRAEPGAGGTIGRELAALEQHRVAEAATSVER